MSDQINLISHKRKKFFHRDSLLDFVQFLARASLITVIISAVGLYILNSSGRLPFLQQQDRTITTNLSLVQQKIIKFLLIRDRLQSINPLLQNKSKVDTLITAFSQGLPASVTVDTFSLTKNNMSLTVSSSSLSSLGTFLDFMLEKVSKKELFKKITITRFTSDGTNGIYILSLAVVPL